MKKILFWLALGALMAFWSTAVFAQPDLRDSIILESKAVPVGAHPGISTDTAAILYIKVWITNKDSLTFVTFAGVERTLQGGAYATLARPRTFNGMVSRLTTTLGTQLITSPNAGTSPPGRVYNSVSPDSMLIAGGYDPFDPATNEPPNLVRKALWEIKFDTVTNNSLPGSFEIDSGRVVQSCTFTNTVPSDAPVNFVKAIITVTNTAVRDVNESQRPESYSLSQNYPNPFNANTQISFALPQSGKTKLEIFNILGQRVNILADEYMAAGYKTVNWDGRDVKGMEVPSGVYFYRLRSEGFLQTKKMLLIK